MFEASYSEVVEALKNEFNHEEPEWYKETAIAVMQEQEKEGDSLANCINIVC